VHGLGPVADDWEAAEVWLKAIASRARRNSPETIATYRYHLAKLRWYCEQVAGTMPSRWSVQNVSAFGDFLKALPDSALCARGDRGRYATRRQSSLLPASPTSLQPDGSSRLAG
jgi:integrase/recombinase XerC